MKPTKPSSKPIDKNLDKTSPEKDEKSPRPFFQYFLAPLLTASLVVILNFLIGPQLEGRKTAQVEIWKQKKEAFVEAANLVSEKYSTLRFTREDTTYRTFDKYDKVNDVYFKLLVFSENEQIADAFWKFFDMSRVNMTAVERANFFSMLKTELIGKKLETDTDSVPVLKNPFPSTSGPAKNNQ